MNYPGQQHHLDDGRYAGHCARSNSTADPEAIAEGKLRKPAFDGFLVSGGGISPAIIGQ
jgi:hypothetical protein